MKPSEAVDAVAERADVMLSQVEELVAIESPSLDTRASARIAGRLASWFDKFGARVEHHETDRGTHLLIEIPGTSEELPMLLIGHSDTVWESGTISSTVPWNVADGVVRGPGAFDMKAGLIMMLTSVDILKDLPRQAVRIIITADEEVGSPSSQELCRQAAQGVAGAIGFESPHPDGALKVGRRGSTRIRLDVSGKASHAALDPDNGISAIDELMDQLLSIRALVDEVSKSSRVLCNVGTVCGGTRTNVIAESASAEIGFRFIDAHSEQEVLDRIGRLTPVRRGARINTTVLSHRPAWQPSAADDLLLREIARSAETFGWEMSGRPAAGGGDTNMVGALGVATVDGFGPRGGGAHATSEHFLLEDLYSRTALLVALLAR